MEKERFYGSDPEYFIYKYKKQTEFGSLPMIIPPASLITDFGLKFTLSPNNKRVLVEKFNYRIIEDGAALELNFKIPLKTSGEFVNYRREALRDIEYLVGNIDYEFKVSYDLLGFFSIMKYWKNRDKTFHDCVRFGCDPDQFPELYILNGFEEETCKEINASKHHYRYAGGHLHIQNMSDNPDVYFENMELAPIIFDFILGTTNILLSRPEYILAQEKARLKYYGRPGRIRLQKYSDKINGIEYRPPSNQWLNDTYNVSKMLSAANVASLIIENNGANLFFNTFKDKVFDMWQALTDHNKTLSKTLLIDSLEWALDNHFITITEMERIYGSL